MGTNEPRGRGGHHQPTLEEKEQPSLLENANIACNMTGDLIGALACELGYGIQLVQVESQKYVKR